MLRLTFSSKLDWASYIASIAKINSTKTGALIRSIIKLIFPEVALYLYKSTMQPCMKYCSQALAGATAEMQNCCSFCCLS